KFESKFKLILVPNYGVHLEWSGCKRDRKLQLNPFAGTQLARHCAANSTQADILRPTGEAGGGSRTKNGYGERNRKLVPGVPSASGLNVGRCGRGCLTHTPPSPSESSLDLRTVKLEYLGPSSISRTTKSEKTSPSSRQCQREVEKGKEVVAG